MNNENLKDQANQIKDKASTALYEGERKVKDFANDAERNIKKAMGQNDCQQIASSIDKQVRQNPWAAVLGVGICSLMLGFIIGTPRK